jgi:PAS domain S-box-containing protein
VRPRSRLETLVLGGFIPTALFVIVGGGFTYTTGATFVQTSERVAHAQEVRAELGRLYGSIADAELAQRNQILTGEESFHTDHLAHVAATRSGLTRLQRLVADNGTQTRLLAQLSTLVAARFAGLEQIGRTLDADGTAAARKSLLADAREGLMTQIQDLTRRMDAEEAGLLDTRLQQAQAQRRTTLVSLLATLAVLTTLFMLLFRSVQREVVARGRVEENLERLNADLEQRVADRTRELDYQQAFLRRVIDLNPNLIFAKDRDGRFVLANAALAEAFGTSVDALVGRRADELDPGAVGLARSAADDRQVIDSGRELLVEDEELLLPGGGARRLNTVKRPILAQDGSGTILLGVSTDITARRAAEDGLRQVAETLERRVAERTLELQRSNTELEQARLQSEAASRAKSAFLANMSHEIRTPMNAIIGLTHLMSREARDGAQHERLSKVGDAAQHLLQVINDILDISKIEAGKLTLDTADFSLDALLQGATDMVRTRAHDKGLELVLDTGAGPDLLRGDSTRLSQIVINLLSNAVKFTEHGWVWLRTRALASTDGRVHLHVEVQDTGPGIPADRQQALFSAFEQVDNSASRQHGGTGLGLALSRQLAIAMGGDAGVESSVGAGSAFWFSVWLDRASASADPLPDNGLAGLRALVVDDLPEALAAVGDQLRGLGFEVDTVASGAAATQRVDAEWGAGRTYDVVLVDAGLKAPTPVELLTRWRAQLVGAMPATLLLGMADDTSTHRRPPAQRFDAFVPKPATATALRRPLSMLLRRHSPVAAPSFAEPSAVEARLRAHHAGQRVLLAEDNPVNLEIAVELLSLAGLVVETAADGAIAVDMALAQHYDLVLMDMQMPVLDGLGAARRIRERLGPSMPIVAMTANAFVDDRQACLAAGMNDHVPKPVSPELMYATLLRWLPLRSATPSAPTPLEALRPA